jgi:uncharacterized protein (DUF433 family)
VTLPDFLHRDADGVIRIQGHRLRLIDIALRYEEGLSPEGICDNYDALTLPLVHKLIAFYLENEVEIAELIAADRQAMDELEARTPKGPTLLELRRRLQTLQPTGMTGDPAALLAADVKWVGDPAEVDALLSEVQRMRDEHIEG